MKTKVVMFLLVGMILAGCASKEESGARSEQESAAKQEEVQQDTTNEEVVDTQNGEAAPEGEYVLTFSAKTIDGEEITSDILSQSKLTMINVWATYCYPCFEEMPALGEIAASYDKSDFQMIGIISDVQAGASQEDIDEAKGLIERTKANYPHLLLNHSLIENLVNGVTVVPTTFFVNAKGEPVGYIIGSNDKQTWEKIIEDLLKEVDVNDEQEQ